MTKKGYKQTEKHKENIKKSHIGLKQSEKTKRKMSENNGMGMLGKKHTETTIKIMSEQKKGENNPMFGKHHTETTRITLRIANTKENNPMYGKGYLIKGKNNPFYGEKHTEETKKRFTEQRKGEGNSMYGKNHKKETIEKIKKARAKQILPVKDTTIEVKIQEFLKKLGIEFYTHFWINDIEHKYQCDIFIPSMNLVIECDGDFIHCNPVKYSPDFVRFPNSKNDKPASVIWEIDNIRTSELISAGFRVLRLWGSEIKKMELNNFKKRIERIQNEC